jgi:hypothetical protein
MRAFGGATLRVHGFPAHEALCQRMPAALEAELNGPDLRVSVEPGACALRGDPHCDYRASWRTTEPGEP